MAGTDVFSAYPRTLHASTRQPKLIWRRRFELIAIHERCEPPPGWEIVLTLEDPPIVICRGDARSLPRSLAQATLSPVYALSGRGAPAVPTGLVLVRFREGIAAAACGDRLARAGFTIHDGPSYAPSAAWVKATAGGIPASLRGIPALESLPDVVNVEPQMVKRAARR